MRKILIIAKREFKTAVRTKGFIIGLLIAPLLMGGGLIVMSVFKDKVDTKDKKIVVIDESGLVGNKILTAAEKRNKSAIYNKDGEKNKPAYIIELVNADTTDIVKQKIELSKRVKKKELHAFVHIESGILHPNENRENAQVSYYSENSLMDDVRDWLSFPINDTIRKTRIKELNIPKEQVSDLFHRIHVEGLGLMSIDEKSGDVKDARKSTPIEALLIPYILMMLMFLLVMMTARPLLEAVLEEKTERISEVLLGSVTPFQFMMGKILGSISVSLTGSAIYILGGIFAAKQYNYLDAVPFDVLPWFFAYLIMNVFMYGSLMAAIGSICNDSKDSQSLQFPIILPLIIPLFLIMPVLREPLGGLATGLSLFPPFTPMLMLVRQSSPVEIPIWQPIVGAIGTLIFTLVSIWIGGRIFRTFILIKGKRPNLKTLIKYSFKG